MMAIIQNTDEFITHSSALYNGRYSYDKATYVNYSTKLIIGCPVHGDFLQSPTQHYKGKGCAKCLRDKLKLDRALPTHPNNIKATKAFIDKCNDANPGKYTYDNTYVPSGSVATTKITITCSVHGVDCTSTKSNLLKGASSATVCTECKIASIHTRAKKVHNDYYTYLPITNFVNQDSEMTSVCHEHGEFTQSINAHLSGKGCRKCATKNLVELRTKNTDQFIEDAIKVHGDKYTYNKVKYTKSANVVTITCPKHGDFDQIANSHLVGFGCNLCGIESAAEKSRYTTDKFIQLAKGVHGDKYGYEHVNYTRSCDQVTIVCKIHGPFSCEAADHLSGCNCPKCSSVGGFKVGLPGYLYYLKVTSDSGEVLYKIGITNRSVEARFSLTELSKIEVLRFQLFQNGKDALDTETLILRECKDYQYTGKSVLVSGNTEMFTVDVLNTKYNGVFPTHI